MVRLLRSLAWLLTIYRGLSSSDCHQHLFGTAVSNVFRPALPAATCLLRVTPAGGGPTPTRRCTKAGPRAVEAGVVRRHLSRYRPATAPCRPATVPCRPCPAQVRTAAGLLPMTVWRCCSQGWNFGRFLVLLGFRRLYSLSGKYSPSIPFPIEPEIPGTQSTRLRPQFHTESLIGKPKIL